MEDKTYSAEVEVSADGLDKRTNDHGYSGVTVRGVKPVVPRGSWGIQFNLVDVIMGALRAKAGGTAVVDFKEQKVKGTVVRSITGVRDHE